MAACEGRGAMRGTGIALCLMPLAALLSACVGGGEPERAAPIRPRAGGPVTLDSTPDRDTRQCFADLAAADVRFSPLPDRDYGGWCQVIGAVQLIDVVTPVAGLRAMRCLLARTFIQWLRGGVAPAAREMLGSPLVRVETYGTFACRGVIGNPASAGRLSQHGLANAVDVAAFVLADGRRITVLGDWNTPDADRRAFLRVVHRSACRRFRTVLGPDYNGAHANHFHLDLGGGALCR